MRQYLFCHSWGSLDVVYEGEEVFDGGEVVAVPGKFCDPIAELHRDLFGFGVFDEVLFVHDEVFVDELQVSVPVFSPHMVFCISCIFIPYLKR